MKISNMQNNGRAVPNQFIITDEGRGALGNFITREKFQSYESIIVEKIVWEDRTEIKLDSKYWDFSATTNKYRNLFLGETKKETQKKINSGEYTLTNLNRN